MQRDFGDSLNLNPHFHCLALDGVYALVDVLRCASCGGAMKVLAASHPPAAQRILECLGLPSRAPPLEPAAHDFGP